MRTPSTGVVALLGCLATAACGDGTSPDIRALVVSPSAGLAVDIGSSVRFSASTLDDSGTPTVTGEAVWGVVDGTIATVDGTGRVTARAEGVTTVFAALGDLADSATFEVFVPEAVAAYEPGVSYFGRADYVEYIPGELPVVLSAPHGGPRTPSEIPDRTEGTFATDRNTTELTLAVRDALLALTGYAPHVVVSHLDRAKLDPNREIEEAAQGNPYAEHAWAEFHGFIETARDEVEGEYGSGMYFDMHGHGHARPRLELGYLLGRSRLNEPDAGLNSPAVVEATSIRELGRTRPQSFAEVVRGSTSLGGFLEAEGVDALPSPSDPFPFDDPYFTGGYSTRRHGSLEEGEVVSGIQIEHHFPGLRDTDANRRLYAERLAAAIRAFMLEHFGFFEPTP